MNSPASELTPNIHATVISRRHEVTLESNVTRVGDVIVIEAQCTQYRPLRRVSRDEHVCTAQPG